MSSRDTPSGGSSNRVANSHVERKLPPSTMAIAASTTPRIGLLPFNPHAAQHATAGNRPG
jgi:hypothetical protein